MHTTEIRRTFLDFFGARDHLRVPSAPLIPSDPSVLLTGAGMAQFVPEFTGTRTPAHPRLMSVQKCARTVDIDNVGHTTRHATLFEMLGSFSFGDYFREEIIAWAYELVIDGFGLDRDRLWVTVFRDDDEAWRLWRRLGLPSERIQRLGMADNYWSMGMPGPCGPSSELFFDRGDGFGEPGGPAVNGERYLEIWNLVFMSFRRGPGDGKEDFPILGALPSRNVDTGMGLDRMALVLQDVRHLCETDLLAPTLYRLQELTGREYASEPEDMRVSMRIVTDHVRAAAYLIADGVRPGNEGRGYVLRRLLRRAVRHTRRLGVDEPVLSALAGEVIATAGGVWPELPGQQDLIGAVIDREEASVERILRRGTRLLDREIARHLPQGVLPASVAFELHDAYGFPIELTEEIVAEHNLGLDLAEYERLMREQRERSRGDRRHG